MEVTIKVDSSDAALAMATFRLGIADRADLMRTIGAGQLVSVRRTVAEGGSPAGSWPPLSPASLSWNKKYTAGHKLLVNTGRGLNSVSAASDNDSATIGTNVFYMAIQQRGWTGSQSVGPYSYTRHTKSRDRFGRQQITNKLGRKQTVRRKLLSGIATVHVSGFTRHISIPARPFLVFRPEDPERIASEVKAFIVFQAQSAGLEAE